MNNAGYEPLYLVLDQGSHASRAILFDATGEMVAREACPIATQRPQQGWVEHDPESVLASLRQVMAAITDGHHITAAGLATQRSSIVCWNRNTGLALSPVISWQDTRAAAWMRSFSRKRSEICARTGLFPSAHYGASKLRWCLDHIPAVRQTLENGELAWGSLASFLLFRLLDNRPLLADAGNASRTLLWNMHTTDWDIHLLEMFGLPLQPLPQCVPNRHDFGYVECSGRKVPVRIVMGDLPASLFAAGRPNSDTAYITAGTGGFVQRVLHQPVENTNGLLTGVVYQDGSNVLYSLEGTVNGAGSALTWFEQTTGFRFADDLMTCDEHIPLFLNGVSGLGSPFWHPGFESRFVGTGELRQQAEAVLESIVFLLQANLQAMEASISPPVAIRMGGGLAQRDDLCQKLANLTGISVMRSTQHEATAGGCAFLLAGCPAVWNTPEADTFRPQADAGLLGRYAHWKLLMERNCSGHP